MNKKIILIFTFLFCIIKSFALEYQVIDRKIKIEEPSAILVDLSIVSFSEEGITTKIVILKEENLFQTFGFEIAQQIIDDGYGSSFFIKDKTNQSVGYCLLYNFEEEYYAVLIAPAILLF